MTIDYERLKNIGIWAFALAAITWLFVSGSIVGAQQRPFTAYPLQGTADTILGPVPIDACLYVTAQGYAVVTEFKCLVKE